MSRAASLRTPAAAGEDLLVLVDEADREIGTLPKTAGHLGAGTLHRAFSVFLFNDRGEVLIQQRAAGKIARAVRRHRGRGAGLRVIVLCCRGHGAFVCGLCCLTPTKGPYSLGECNTLPFSSSLPRSSPLHSLKHRPSPLRYCHRTPSSQARPLAI